LLLSEFDVENGGKGKKFLYENYSNYMILKAGRNERVHKDFNVYYDKHIIDA